MNEVKIVCRALITDTEGRILFARKTGSSFWSLPGGKLDADDADVQACLLRELKEELGITGKVGAIRFVQELRKDSSRYIELIWDVSTTDNPISENIYTVSDGELDAIKWIGKNELHTANIKPDFLKELA